MESLFLLFIILAGFVSGMKFMDSTSPVMFLLDSFHKKVLVLLICMMTFVFFGLFFSLNFKGKYLTFSDKTNLEIAWTVMPSMILVVLAIPSLKLLYISEGQINKSMPEVNNVGVVSHQWYWSYNISGMEYDSFILKKNKCFRLLETDLPLFVQAKSLLQFNVTSSDVLHCFSIPSMGLKIDCVPGRLSSQIKLFKVLGVYYGQCSEICGVNHSFMPICIEVV